MRDDYSADVAVIGGGLGGCAAALAALRQGLHVVMTEEMPWVGGQMTSQGVPPDEHRWIESAANPSYAAFRNRVRDYYRQHFALKPEVAANPHMNPGGGKVSRLCCEPWIAHAVLDAMLAPCHADGRLTLLLRHRPVAAQVSGDRVDAVELESMGAGETCSVSAPLFIDATETGDLLPLAGVEYVSGAESQSETGEPHAAAAADPLNMQAITWCFAMTHHPGEDHTIAKPRMYDFWRGYVPAVSPPWPGKLLSWTYSHPPTLKPYQIPFHPTDEPGRGFWLYRRIRSAAHYTEPPPGGDITLVNWPMNDYFRKPIIEVDEETRRAALEEARQLSLSWFYWLQTEAPREDGGVGWPGLRLCPEAMGTEDGLAMAPYVRESRRIRALYTVREQDVGADTRAEILGTSPEEARAVVYEDSVGIGSYRNDLHPSTGGDNYIDFAAKPFEIPLGALIPQRMENLLAGGKNLGVTHITTGCYRLHPVEWNVGEAAGLLAAECLRTGEPPQHVRSNSAALADFLRLVDAEGILRHWPDEPA